MAGARGKGKVMLKKATKAALRIKKSPVVYGILMRCFEMSTAGGVSAQAIGAGGGGGSSATAMDRGDVAKVLTQFFALPDDVRAAMSAVIFHENFKLGEAAAKDLASTLYHKLTDTPHLVRYVARWGLFGVEYFVFNWVAGVGSCREFSKISTLAGYPVSHETSSEFCKTLQFELDRLASCGEAALYSVCCAADSTLSEMAA